MTEQNVFELLIESIQSSSATFQEKIKMMDALKAYIDYKYKQTLNLIK